MVLNRTLDLLNKSLDKRIIIKLRGNTELSGKLIGFDQHLNLVLDNTHELLNNGQGDLRKLGRIILRGDNVIVLSPNVK